MLTIKEAAEYADKSTSWIRKKILSGELEAEKKAFKYGKRWETTKQAIDDLLEQAKMEKEVVDVREVDKAIPVKQFKNELLKATESQNRELINKAVENITEEIKSQSTKIDNQENKIEKQNQAIKELTKEVKKMREQQKKSIIDKIINIFK